MDQLLFQLLDYKTLLLVFLGVFFGIILSAIPGLTASMGIALAIPYTFALPPMSGISFILGIYVGGMYGGAITAILIRTPGTPSAAASILDGYPMAAKGDAAKALKWGIISSFIGGIISTGMLILIAPQLAKVALQFGPAEYFALAIFGLSIVGVVSGKYVVRGLIVGVLGLIVATVGMDPIGGMPRFTFGSTNLTAGISLIPALMGLFAVSQVIKEVVERIEEGGEKRVVKYKKQRVPFKDVISKWFHFVRAAVIGTLVGLVPGTGSSIATFVSYNESRRFAKPERRKEYGTGIPEGVIATETSNNAITGGALIPLLTLGIPGDVVTAIILGGFLIHGIQPGPQLFEQQGDLVYGLFGMLIVANIFMLLIGWFGIKLFGRIINIPKSILLPIIVAFSFFGSYALSNNIFDVWTALVFGVIGYLLERYSYPLAPFILGIVLGPIIESNLRRTIIESGHDYSVFFTRPISAIFIILTILSFMLPLLRKVWSMYVSPRLNK
ncbi:tripartite tricarboxylate transporter permease [Virgibacillus natechei]|uniref:tripartite tricarboxylate transporter permease n=1 Tax=Virgibacillus sp. CBA3643 TaxID=2942278 RepID=UPI0035A2C124